MLSVSLHPPQSNEQMRTNGSLLDLRRSALTDQLQTLMDQAVDAITNSVHVHLDQVRLKDVSYGSMLCSTLKRCSTYFMAVSSHFRN